MYVPYGSKHCLSRYLTLQIIVNYIPQSHFLRRYNWIHRGLHILRGPVNHLIQPLTAWGRASWPAAHWHHGLRGGQARVLFGYTTFSDTPIYVTLCNYVSISTYIYIIYSILVSMCILYMYIYIYTSYTYIYIYNYAMDSNIDIDR